ncbi:MAG: sensor histidine kinase, partial [Pseudomonadota bacterium]|nr:sensor histidine kinase [Pseudomonadota bacterium]
IEIEAEVDEVSLLIDRAVPLGLVVNEVITNCVKHAFGDAGGRITVKLTAGVGYGEARLTISDNGRGIQDDRGHGSGLKLVEALTRQIGGQFEQQSSSKGTTTTVVFPVIA